MKEKLYTIPLTEAFGAGEECPFCYIERQLEREALDFTLGDASSYMESDIREKTDEMGFCKGHFKKMYQYGNSLGNALILKTHFKKINQEFIKQLQEYKPDKQGLFDKLKKGKEETGTDKIGAWVAQKEETCYICSHIKNTYERYIDTFFYLFKTDLEFRELIKDSKGFCLHHFGELTSLSSKKLNEIQCKEYASLVFPLMIEHMNQMEEDISWLVEKYDYRNVNADWKNSKDALQRGMQKIRGGYPADSEYQKDR